MCKVRELFDVKNVGERSQKYTENFTKKGNNNHENLTFILFILLRVEICCVCDLSAVKVKCVWLNLFTWKT